MPSLRISSPVVPSTQKEMHASVSSLARRGVETNREDGRFVQPSRFSRVHQTRSLCGMGANEHYSGLFATARDDCPTLPRRRRYPLRVWLSWLLRHRHDIHTADRDAFWISVGPMQCQQPVGVLSDPNRRFRCDGRPVEQPAPAEFFRVPGFCRLRFGCARRGGHRPPRGGSGSRNCGKSVQ